MTLMERGYIFRDEGSGKYRLTSKLVEVGCGGMDEYSLVHVGWPLMVDLRNQKGVNAHELETTV